MNFKEHREINAQGLELMRARTELAFLLSDHVCTPASEVITARERIHELLDRIPMNGSCASSKCLDFAAMSTEKSGFDGPIRSREPHSIQPHDHNRRTVP